MFVTTYVLTRKLARSSALTGGHDAPEAFPRVVCLDDVGQDVDVVVSRRLPLHDDGRLRHGRAQHVDARRLARGTWACEGSVRVCVCVWRVCV